MVIKHYKTGEIKEIPDHAVKYHTRLNQDGISTWEVIDDAIKSDRIPTDDVGPEKKKKRADRLSETAE